MKGWLHLNSQKAPVGAASRIARRTLVLSALLAALAGGCAAPKPQVEGKGLSLVRAAAEIQATLSQMDEGAKKAALRMGVTGITGDEARRVLKELHKACPMAVDVVTADAEGRVTMVEPATAAKIQGADISSQPHFAALRKTRQPMLSMAFRSVEGPQAVALQYPVFATRGDFIGVVSVLFRPQAIIGPAVSEMLEALPVDVWAVQSDGVLLFDPDTEEIGRNILKDKVYAQIPGLVSATKKIVASRSGFEEYDYVGRGIRGSARIRASWQTVGVLGAEWRLVVTRNVLGEGAANRRQLSHLGLLPEDKALAALAGSPDMASALAEASQQKAMPLFARLFQDVPGLFVVQWVDAAGMCRFGYPAHNALTNRDLKENPTPDRMAILNAVEKRSPATFKLVLPESGEGLLRLEPVFKGNEYVGAIYTIRVTQ
ncbi:MAG TPA: cache domain-containing protein [Candidatus Brocadiia bacterium]|nr:cache domain-containing protein [Candidatus Brocadiia bacterium]